MQRLLVVTATYRKPSQGLLQAKATSAGGSGGKFAGVTLSYGSRHLFVNGLDDILAQPILTMEQEFARRGAFGIALHG